MELDFVPFDGTVSMDNVQFPHPFYDEREEDEGMPPRTLIELQMCNLSATLRSKPEWWRKYKDGDIRGRWEKEALEQGLTQDQVDYVLAELDGYAALRDAVTGIEVSCFDGIWQSDALVPDSLRDALKAAVAPLENVPDDQKDWHPRSNGQVLDLVHPSLYPLVYGRSLVRDRSAKTFKVDVAKEPDVSTVESERFAWLPTDFVVGASGAHAKGYINNVHPAHSALLLSIDRLVGAFVPLFEHVLADLLSTTVTLRVSDQYTYEDDSGPEPLPDEEPHDFDARYEHWYENERKIVLPEVPEYSGSIAQRDHTRKFSLRGRTVQVIVKFANIILTPAQPEYAGGSWHVEGMLNERIVASGIYYYDEENITESRLAFRAAVSAPENYEQSDYSGAEKVWGISVDDLLVQDLGSVQTKAGRCIAFPNIFQHCVTPFSLVDRTRPGRRKIAALFLVDPRVRIPSTSDVAPQQKQLLLEALAAANGPIKKLPQELLQLIIDAETHSMIREEAFAYREELMEERTRFVQESNDEGFFGATFNMCEH